MKILNKFKEDWKRYAIILTGFILILLLGIVIGLSLKEVDVFKQIIINTISGIINNLPWFILIYISIKILSKAIKESGNKILKKVPKWIEEYFKKRKEMLIIEGARRNF